MRFRHRAAAGLVTLLLPLAGLVGLAGRQQRPGSPVNLRDVVPPELDEQRYARCWI